MKTEIHAFYVARQCRLLAAAIAFLACLSLECRATEATGGSGPRADLETEGRGLNPQAQLSNIEVNNILGAPDEIEKKSYHEVCALANKAFSSYMAVGTSMATGDRERLVRTRLKYLLKRIGDPFEASILPGGAAEAIECKKSIYYFYGMPVEPNLTRDFEKNAALFFDSKTKVFKALLIYMTYNLAVSIDADMVRQYLSGRHLQSPASKLDAIVYSAVSDSINEHESNINLFIVDFAPYLTAVNPVFRMLAVEGVYECGNAPVQQAGKVIDASDGLVMEKVHLLNEMAEENDPAILNALIDSLLGIKTQASLDILKQANNFHVRNGNDSLADLTKRAIERLAGQLNADSAQKH